MYKPEQSYSSMYSDAPKSSQDEKSSYGYQAQASGATTQGGTTAEAYYAQQEAMQIMQQQQQEYEKQAAKVAASQHYARRDRSRSPVRTRDRSRSPAYAKRDYDRDYRKRSPSPRRDHHYRSSRDEPRDPYRLPSSSSRALDERKIVDELLHDYQCGSLFELRDKLERTPENRSLRLANENLKNIYLTMVSSVQDSTFQEVQKLCTTNVQLQDEIARLGGRPPIRGASSSKGGSEKPAMDGDAAKKLDQLQRDLEDEVAAKKELKRDIDKLKKERDESKKRAESYKEDYVACYEDLKIERKKTERLMEENEKLKAGGTGIATTNGSSGAIVKQETVSINEQLKAKNEQMRRELELQSQQLKNMDRTLAKYKEGKETGYSFEIESDDDTMNTKKLKSGN